MRTKIIPVAYHALHGIWKPRLGISAMKNSQIVPFFG
jgi:hypothetical protein